MMRSTAVLLGLLLTGIPAAASAKTLYVNGANGSDATTYADNSAARPWKTIGRAAWGSPDRNRRNGAEAARAGDTVVVASGTYATPGTNSRNENAYYTENSGEPGRPITFKADGPVVLTLSSGRGTLIGAYRRNYITWDGFTIHEKDAPSHPDTGPVTIWFCTGCVLQNLDIDGNGDDNGRQDNHTGIRIEQSRDILIRNNRIRNVYTAHNVNNGAAIQVYSSGGITFEHNEISDSGAGIFLKGGPPTNLDHFTIRYNLIYGIGETEGGEDHGNAIILHAGAPNRPEAPVRIYQNVIRDVKEAAVKIWMFDGRDPSNNPMNARIVNNTIDRCGNAVWVTHDLLPDAGHLFANNVVTNTRRMVMAYGGSRANLTKERFESRHNVFHRQPLFATIGNDEQGFGGWKRLGQDGGAQASIEADPRYVNAASGDYRLQPQSPARGVGIDVLDLNGNGSTTDVIPAGAFITGSEIIGRR